MMARHTTFQPLPAEEKGRWPGLVAGTVLLVVLVVSGCQVRTAPTAPPPATPTDRAIPTVTATPSPSPTPPPPATPSPTLTPSPTPTPLPHVRLQEARRLQVYGQRAEAQRLYAALATAPEEEVPDEARMEAAFRLGECYHLGGHYLEAAEALKRFLEEHPDAPFRAEALFRLADSLAQTGQLEEAVARYRDYLALDDTLADVVYERLGDAFAAREADEEAITWYTKAVDVAPDLARALALQEKIAEAQVRLQEVEEAEATYRAILGRSRYAPYRARILYRLAEVLREAGRKAEALRLYQAVVDEDVRSEAAYLAMVRLVEAGAKVDEFQRGLADYSSGVYWLAAAAFQRVLDDVRHPQREEARLYLARSYRALGLFRTAAEGYRLAVQEAPKAPWVGDAWLEWAETLQKAGQPEEARRVLQEFARKYPQHVLAPQALWQGAQVLEAAEGCLAALEEYRALATSFPRSPYAVDALVQAGLCLYEQGRIQEALDPFQRAVALAQEQGEGDRLWRAVYWTGKALFHLGRLAEAEEAWQPLLTEAQETFYALRARETLGDLPSPEGLAQPSAAEDAPDLPEEASLDPAVLQWMATWARKGSTAPPEAAFREDRRFRRALAMMPVGLVQEAEAELESLRSALADDPVALYGLAMALRQQGLYRQSALAASRAFALSPRQALADVPPSFARLLYPVAYRSLLLRECAEQGLNPYLVAAIIRQESLFEVGAISTAQARGLMQVIGPTGEWVAWKLGWTSFQEEMLHLPYVNVRFGTYYLRVQLDAFGGDVVRALVAYNAGPGRAREWGKGIADPDLFLERIPLEEPRRYVERVVQGYHRYRSLYVEDLVARKP
ncbi:MAG: tetratricopeptide repeat protein [Anaerolineae bacterium]